MLFFIPLLLCKIKSYVSNDTTLISIEFKIIDLRFVMIKKMNSILRSISIRRASLVQYQRTLFIGRTLLKVNETTMASTSTKL